MDHVPSPRSSLQHNAATAAKNPSARPEDVIKVLISTDNHLGYMEKDPVRCDDSFRAFEEILELAKVNAVDMLLLAGNLFHDKKPSHSTLVRTMRLLRYHCLSPKGGSRLSVRSEPSAVHFTDPCNPVSLPVFVIHGNRDGPVDGLSPLDVLAQTGLVTYFGCNLSGNEFDMAPILLQKGCTSLALYGQGNVRDGVLSDAWAEGRLRWHRAEQPTISGEIAYRVDLKEENTNPETTSLIDTAWLNLFVLHQTRRVADSAQGVPDALLPIWMDYVVWGHEHESKPELSSSRPPVVQPGSTVATSLSEGEAKQKHAILLEVFKDKDESTHRPVPLQAVRSLHFEDVSLLSQSGVPKTDPKSVNTFLQNKINGIVGNQEVAFDSNIASFRDGTSEMTFNEVRYPSRSFYIEKLSDLVRQPLVRLRVEANWRLDPPNPHRFGQRFIGRVASPSGLLSFERPQRRIVRRSGTRSQNDDVMEEVEGDGEISNVSYSQTVVDEQDVARIPKLLQYFLCHPQAGGTGLKFFELDKLMDAVDKFVEDSKKHSRAIPDHIGRFLKEQQERTLSEVTQAGHIFEETELLAKFESGAKDAAKRALVDAKPSQSEGKAIVAATDATHRTDAQDEDVIQELGQSKLRCESIEENLEDIHAAVSGPPKLAAALTKLSLRKSAKEELAVKAEKVPGKKGSKDCGNDVGLGSNEGRVSAPGAAQIPCSLSSGKKGGSKNVFGMRDLDVIVVDDSDDDVMIIEDSNESPNSRRGPAVRSMTGISVSRFFDVQKSAEDVDEIEAVNAPSGALRRRQSESGQHSTEKTGRTSSVPRHSGREVTRLSRLKVSVPGTRSKVKRIGRKRPAETSEIDGPSRKLAATVVDVITEKNDTEREEDVILIEHPPGNRTSKKSGGDGPLQTVSGETSVLNDGQIMAIRTGSETQVRSLASMSDRQTDAGASSVRKARPSSAARRSVTKPKSQASPDSGGLGHTFTRRLGEKTPRPQASFGIGELMDAVKIPRAVVKPTRSAFSEEVEKDVEHRPGNALGNVGTYTGRESIEESIEKHGPRKRYTERTLSGGKSAARGPFQPTGRRRRRR